MQLDLQGSMTYQFLSILSTSNDDKMPSIADILNTSNQE